jgi:hypothetical protein
MVFRVQNLVDRATHQELPGLKKRQFKLGERIN